MNLTKKLLFFLIYILISIIFLEIFSYILFKNFFDIRYRAEVFKNISYKNDKLLGWDAYNGEPRPSESVLNTNNKNEACAYIFGDSFSHSDEVLDNETWGEILAKKMKCPIYNYGVGGYGSDQSLLKLQRILSHPTNNFNKSKTIFFGVYQEMLRRNLSASWVFYCCPDEKNSLKPYFVSEDGQSLKLIEIPDNIILENVIKHHKFDYYYPHYDNKISFPFLISIVKNLHSRLSNSDSKEIIYPGHVVYSIPKALKIQKLIMIEASKIANKFGYDIVFVFFPTPDQAYNHFNHYKLFHDEIVEQFNSNKNITVIDLYPELVKKSASTNRSLRAPEGHYDVEGNKYIADIIFNAIQN